MPAVRRFEKRGRSFWEVIQIRSVVMLRWGLIGSPGRTKPAALLVSEVGGRVEQKLSDEYVEVTPLVPEPLDPAAGPIPAELPAALRCPPWTVRRTAGDPVVAGLPNTRLPHRTGPDVGGGRLYDLADDPYELARRLIPAALRPAALPEPGPSEPGGPAVSDAVDREPPAPQGSERFEAGRALRALAGHGHHQTVLDAAADYGPAVAAAIPHVLWTDPRDTVPMPIPPLPAWLDPATLAVPEPLTTAAAQHLVTMLMVSTLDEPYAGLGPVRVAYALSAFVRSLFAAFQQAGHPRDDGWVIAAVGLFGDDEAAAELAAAVDRWPRTALVHLSVPALRALAAIGTGPAFTLLYDLSRRARAKTVRDRAAEVLAELARGWEVEVDRLADRLVPRFGLDADGELHLDGCVVGFDEALRPYVRGTVPADAKDRVRALRKDVPAVATDQIGRLERLMVAGYRWSAEEFQAYVVGHPILRLIARRLIWTRHDGPGGSGAIGPGGTGRGSFRIAEDGSYADAADRPVTLPPTAAVGVAHPLDLGDALATWRDVVADYEIVQPFPQVGRETYGVEPDDPTSTLLARFVGVPRATVEVSRLVEAGWQPIAPRRHPGTNRVWGELQSPARGDLVAVLLLDPGLPDPPTAIPEITLGVVALRGPGAIPLAELDPVLLSELVREIEHMCG